jgi:hypothetical protein
MWQGIYSRERAKIIEIGSKLETISTREQRYEVIWLFDNWKRINVIG